MPASWETNTIVCIQPNKKIVCMNTIFIELSDEAQNGDDVFASTEDREESHFEELSNKGNLKYVHIHRLKIKLWWFYIIIDIYTYIYYI